jgi:GTP-binding protein EngB required for normal cell division
MHLHSRTPAVTEDAVRCSPWQAAVAEFGRALGGRPAQVEGQDTLPFEIGIVGLSGVGKSSLLNALIAPACELLPSGGVGPLTGVPVRIGHAPFATLRVKYHDRAWLLDALKKLDGSTPGPSNDELGLFSLICTGDQYTTRDPVWLAQSLRYALRPDVAKSPDATERILGTLRRLHELLHRQGSVRQWDSESPDRSFFRLVHEHISGSSAALCEVIELGWPSAMLENQLTLVDLPGLGMVNDSYSRHTNSWVERARAILVVTDRAGITESMVTCLRRNGFLERVVEGHADLIGVMTKLDQVTDDARRRDRSTQSWSRCFRATTEQAETELLSQIHTVLRSEQGIALGGHAGASLRAEIRVFGVSSREHQRVVARDPEDRPRLLIRESSGVPAVRRALAALARLRSSRWTSEILDRARASPDAATLLPELFSLVDMEGL